LPDLRRDIGEEHRRDAEFLGHGIAGVLQRGGGAEDAVLEERARAATEAKPQVVGEDLDALGFKNEGTKAPVGPANR
jgi:hypothetical protein